MNLPPSMFDTLNGSFGFLLPVVPHIEDEDPDLRCMFEWSLWKFCLVSDWMTSVTVRSVAPVLQLDPGTS